MTDKEAKQATVKKQLGNDNFLRQQQAKLKIEHSEERFRVHEFTCSAMMLPNFRDYDRLSPLIDGLLAELDPNDSRGCSTALELLAEIASSSRQNAAFFQRIALLGKVYHLFQQSKADPFCILHIECMRFFGYLSTADPDALINFPEFTADVFDSVYKYERFDATRRQKAFETLAVVSSTSGAKKFLFRDDCPYNMCKALNHLCAAVAIAGQPEMKARYLGAVRLMFDSFDERRPDESAQILHRWFGWLGDPFPKMLFKCLQMHIPEVQEATLQALLALMRHQWAYPIFCSLPSFVDFLIDRSADFSAEGYRLKHDLVCRVVDSASHAIDPAKMELLQDYRAKGPIWPAQKASKTMRGDARATIGLPMRVGTQQQQQLDTRRKRQDSEVERNRMQREQFRHGQQVEYQRGLAAHRAKQEDLKRKREAEQDEMRKRAHDEHEKQKHQSALACVLPDEPAADDPEAITVRLRFPNSESCMRRFRASESVEMLLFYAETLGYDADHYNLWTSDRPKLKVSALNTSKSFAELKWKREIVTVEEK